MTFGRRGFLGILCVTILFVLPARPASAQQVDLTPEQIEAFLLKARIVSTRSAGSGVTDSRRATLSDGVITHDAHIQTVDVSRPVFEAGRASEVNFRDSYRYNIAGYRLARMLGLDNVPVSVERSVNRRAAAVTWWVDDVLMSEGERIKQQTVGPDPDRTAKQIQIMHVFDELIQNRDRNQGNVLWDANWKMWMIDHTRAFRLGRSLVRPNELRRCDRALLQALRTITEDAVAQAMGRNLARDEVRALLARRDLLVAHFDRLIAERGEDVVLFTF
jgi:hypothetical protein